MRQQVPISWAGRPRGVPLLVAPAPRRARPWRALAAGGFTVAVIGTAGLFLLNRNQVDVRMTGMADGASIKPDAIGGQTITIHGAAKLRNPLLALNGVALAPTIERGAMSWVTPRLVEGEYRLTLQGRRPVRGTYGARWHFRVDGTPPKFAIAGALDPVAIDQPFVLQGGIDPDATVTVDGKAATVEEGRFSFSYDLPPAAPVQLVATDAAGNTTTSRVIVPVIHPPTRSIHVTFNSWASESFRKQVYGLIADRRITAVQLDLKDESGQVGYDTDVALAKQIGARRPTYALKAAVDDLHARGAKVIGRIVAFRDPILAQAAWDNGDVDWVLQSPEGGPLAAYGGFTNYVHAAVRKYNADIAIEAAKRGVDEILWDYIRRPEGDPATMVVPGLGDKQSAEVVASFLAQTHTPLRQLGVFQGASVFGIAASRPKLIGQDVSLLALHTDYLAPMVYPSHWNRGEYGVADPNRQPYDIVSKSLADFQQAMTGTNKSLMPWLQDFSQGVEYGPREVLAQVKAAEDLNIKGFLLWNPSSRYSLDALKPQP